MRPIHSLLLVIALLVPAHSSAHPQLRLRISLAGFYLEESELGATGLPVFASIARLGLADARLVIDGKELARRLALRVDLRSRLSGSLNPDASSFDFESKFAPQYFATPNLQVGSRGYLGGPELLDLRELYLRISLSPRWDLSMGRFFVSEASAQKVDGLRLQLRASSRWEAGLFAGGAPNAVSRYVLYDYDSPCGHGVAAGLTQIPLNSAAATALGSTLPAAVMAAGEPCQRSGPQLALTGGITALLRLPRLWAQGALVGAYYDGEGSISPVERDPALADRVGNLLPSNRERETPRIFFSFTGQASPWSRLSLFADGVIDFAGPSGAQLTRVVLTSTLQVLPGDRLGVRATYSYLSSLAIGMFLRNQLYNRSPNGTTPGGLGVVENNLTLLRTGRHEARLATELRIAGMTRLVAEGRLRQRSLLGGETSREVYENPAYSDFTRSWAGDLSLSLRDGGTVRPLRGLLSYSYLRSFRSENHAARIQVGTQLRRPDRDLFTFDVEYSLLSTLDQGTQEPGCNDPSVFPGAQRDGVARLDPQMTVFASSCFGRRSGITHELGGTLSFVPTRQLAFLLDYRLSVMNTDDQPEGKVPSLLGHALLVRIEGSIDVLH